MASCTMVTKALSRMKGNLGVALTNPPHLVLRLKKKYSYTSAPLVSTLHVMRRRLCLLGPRNEVTAKYKELGNKIIHKKLS
jgi:hypothetical protein